MKKLQKFFKENFSSIFALVVMSGIIAWIAIQGPSQLNLPNPTVSPDIGLSPESRYSPIIKDWPFLGNVEAPVVFVEYGDYNCGYCGKFNQDVLPKIKEKYIDTGMVKFVFKDFVIFGEESQLLAEAVHCAGEQGKFFEAHDFVFQNDLQGFSAEKLAEKFATSLGVNARLVSECLKSGRYVDLISESTQEAASFGLTGTPMSIINGRLVEGAQSLSVFSETIEAALED